MSEMLEWLKQQGLGEYAEIFAKNGIDMRALPHLTEQDLNDLGVLLGHRRIILAAIKALSEQGIVPADEPDRDAAEVTSPNTTEHRQVTILFADLAGYTKMSAELDAEETHAVLGKFLDAADRIIVEHGGTIDKHVGDCVMAVFGAPIAHSNDPARAARAALGIQAAMPSVSDAAGRDLHVHIGIANGQVLASGVGSDTHYTVTGDSVNLASRLTDAASQDETMLSQGVQTAISAEFELLDKGKMPLKGIRNPVRAYSLLGLAGAESAQSERPFVGRRVELQQFSGVLQACAEIQSGQLVYLRGEAGIGKTRLGAKFEARAKELDYACHRALVLDFGAGKEQNVVRTLTCSLLSIPSDSTLEMRKQAVNDTFFRSILEPDQRVYLNAILGIPQGAELRSLYDAIDSEGREQGKDVVVTALVRNLSAQRPMLIFVEDIHWADDSVIRFLGKLSETLVNTACILVLTSRVEGDPLDQSWKQQTASTPLTTIDLRPLRRDDALAMAADYFDASSRFAQKCVERADGNPLYLEQLLSNAEDMSDDQVPGSVHSIVQARLDSLPAIDKQAIQAASVLGQRFTLDDIRFMLNEAGYGCEDLVARNLIKSQGSAYLFSHALVQEAVYESLLKSRRAVLHRAAAKWYEHRELELCAVHLDRARDPDAAQAYLDAAKAQLVELQFNTSLALAKRGIELSKADETTCSLLLVQAEILRNLGDIEESITACREALNLAQPGPDLCLAWLGLAEGFRIADQQVKALEALDSAESVALEYALKPQLSRLHYLRGNLFFMMGDIGGCLAEHEKSLTLADETGSAEGKALAFGGLGDAYYLRGHMRSARDQFQACLDLCGEYGFGQIAVANRYMVGWSRYHLMEFREAMDDARASIEMASKVGHHRAEMISAQLAALIEMEQGKFSESRVHLERALALTNILMAGNFVAQVSFFLARLDIAEGDLSAARNNTELALNKVREVGMAFIGPAVLSLSATLSTDPKQRLAFQNEAEQLLDAGCVSHNYFHYARSMIELGLRLEDWDLIERQASRLEDYTAGEALEWSDFIIARGRVLAALGRGERSDVLVNELQKLHAQGTKAGLKLMLNALETAIEDE